MGSIVGGLPFRTAWAKYSNEALRNTFNDLDLITATQEHVLPTLEQDFEILHFHKKDEFFYYQLRDKQTNLIIDIFTEDPKKRKCHKVEFEGIEIIVPTIPDMLLQKYEDLLSGFSQNQIIEPKYLQYIKALEKMTDKKEVVELWEERQMQKRQGIYSLKSLDEVRQKISELTLKKPHLIRKKDKKTVPISQCQECQTAQK